MELCGLQVNAYQAAVAKGGHNYAEVTTEELIYDLQRVARLLKVDTVSSCEYGQYGDHSTGTYFNRFGTWNRALERFVTYINEEELSELNSIECRKEENENSRTVEYSLSHKEYAYYKHKTPRDINLKLRFKVMKRDNFKCCLCGASPAKDPSVELHIDHIKPWSKDGETVMENLQTLCDKCNLGKSDLEIGDID